MVGIRMRRPHHAGYSVSLAAPVLWAAVFQSLLAAQLPHVSFQNLPGTPRAMLCTGPT